MSLIFNTFGSSSKGNMYLLEGVKESLIIECGISIKDTTIKMSNKWDKVVGCLISHEHNDHSKLLKYMNRSGIDCYMHEKTINNLNEILKIKNDNHRNIKMELLKDYLVGTEWGIRNFELQHDVPNFGFYIHHFPTGQITIYITDTYYCKYKFVNVHNIIVEANYSKKLLNEADLYKNKRLIDSHFEIDETIKFCQESNNKNLKNIILVHLSESGAEENLFLSKFKNTTDFDNKNIFIAKDNPVINL